MSNLSDLIPPRLGTSGYSGYSSSSGTSGYSGHSGYSAYSGYSGYSGKSGYSAYSGTSWSGYSAYSGSSGTSAYSGVAGAATGNLDVTVTAGEALSARDFVYVAPVTGGGLTAGRAYKADADTVRASTQGFYFGFVVANISAAATGTVRLMGSMAGFTVTEGAPQYLSTTAGAITETAPTNSLMVGIALDSSTVLINSFGSNAGITSDGDSGYFVGGFTGAPVATSDKIVFSTDITTASTSSNLTDARYALAGLSNPSNAGYVSGGVTGAEYKDSTDKLTFSTSTTASCTTATLSTAMSYMAGLSELSTKGYFAGGRSSAGGHVQTTDKITFSTESIAAVGSAQLGTATHALAACTQGTTKGYMSGGITGNPYAAASTAYKITYSNDTTASSSSSNLSQSRAGLVGISRNNVCGYFSGGDTDPGVQATTDKLTFSNDTTSAVSTANLSQARSGLAGCSNGGVKGYFAGGSTGLAASSNKVTTSDKLTYATDVTAASTVSNLSQARYHLAGLSDVGW